MTESVWQGGLLLGSVRAIHCTVAHQPLGTLYVVASSIGNPGDFSPRAIETLKMVDVVLAEDTRSARKLLSSYGIDRRTQSCFDANEPERAEEAHPLARGPERSAAVRGRYAGSIRSGLSRGAGRGGSGRARGSDSRAVRFAGGAGGFSGLPTDSFFFAGFPPRKSRRAPPCCFPTRTAAARR